MLIEPQSIFGLSPIGVEGAPTHKFTLVPLNCILASKNMNENLDCNS